MVHSLFSMVSPASSNLDARFDGAGEAASSKALYCSPNQRPIIWTESSHIQQNIRKSAWYTWTYCKGGIGPRKGEAEGFDDEDSSGLCNLIEMIGYLHRVPMCVKCTTRFAIMVDCFSWFEIVWCRRFDNKTMGHFWNLDTVPKKSVFSYFEL